MTMIGVLGGMGPAATVDFVGKLVSLTPARRDQDHLPVLVANLPHVPDRSNSILGRGADPLPYLLKGIELLNQAGVGLIVVPCNTSHHWYDAMAERSDAPMIHIASACVAALSAAAAGGDAKVSLFATRGTIRSGFYQRVLARRGIACGVPAPEGAQRAVDDCIRATKAGDLAGGSAALELALADARSRGVQAVIMACTEIPVAAKALDGRGIVLVDSSLELARAAAEHALRRGWNRPPWPATDFAASMPAPLGDSADWQLTMQ